MNDSWKQAIQKEGVRKVDIGVLSVSHEVFLSIFSFQHEDLQQKDTINYMHTSHSSNMKAKWCFVDQRMPF